LAVAHPGNRLRQHVQRLDDLELRLKRAVGAGLEGRRQRLGRAAATLAAHRPGPRLRAAGERLAGLEHRLDTAMRHRLEALHARTGSAARTLHSVSPLATLERGYAIATRAADGAILYAADQVAAGEGIEVRLARGSISALVRGSDVGEEGSRKDAERQRRREDK
ncbi:MAG: exodeoxyribonuclease VII large subunit, partial [Gammaproteobacteria bacterium]